MSSLKKYPIIILAILILANFLPKAYEDIFSQRSESIELNYSAVSESFLKTISPKDSNKETIYSSLDGKSFYTNEQYQEFFPFDYYFNLIKWDKFPKKLQEFQNNTKIIMASKQFAHLGANAVDSKIVNLLPLFETQSKFFGLKFPDDIFRFTSRMEFINIQDNKVNEEKTTLFTNALKQKGFIFPALKIFGNPTTMKSFDAGYFVLDSKKDLFQIKMQKQKPFIKHIKTPNINIKHITIREHKRQEFYGLALSEDQKVYLFMQDDYEFVQLPIEKFDYKKQTITLTTDPLHRHIKVRQIDKNKHEKSLKVYVTNLDYELIAKEDLKFKYNSGNFYEYSRKLLFPFELNIVKTGDYSYFPQLTNFKLWGFYLNIFLLLVYILYLKKQKRSIKEHGVNSVFILFAGVYSLLCIYAFDNLIKPRRRL